MIGDVLDFTIGALEIVLAATVLRHLWRFRRGFPWLIALTAFFFLRGLDRLIVAFVDEEPAPLSFLVDALLVAVLALLLFAMERVVRGLELGMDAARFQEREYRRALVDYRRLARHRLANPITAIAGSARALRELTEIDEKLRAELLDVIHREALRLEAISLDPRDALGPEEALLRPQPELRFEDEADPGRDPFSPPW